LTCRRINATGETSEAWQHTGFEVRRGAPQEPDPEWFLADSRQDQDESGVPSSNGSSRRSSLAGDRPERDRPAVDRPSQAAQEAASAGAAAGSQGQPSQAASALAASAQAAAAGSAVGSQSRPSLAQGGMPQAAPRDRVLSDPGRQSLFRFGSDFDDEPEAGPAAAGLAGPHGLRHLNFRPHQVDGPLRAAGSEPGGGAAGTTAPASAAPRPAGAPAAAAGDVRAAALPPPASATRLQVPSRPAAALPPAPSASRSQVPPQPGAADLSREEWMRIFSSTVAPERGGGRGLDMEEVD